MRTTVTIDDGLLADVKALAARQRRTLSAVVQDALRQTLDAATGRPQPPVELPTFGGADGVALVDHLDREALADALGDNDRPGRDV